MAYRMRRSASYSPAEMGVAILSARKPVMAETAPTYRSFRIQKVENGYIVSAEPEPFDPEARRERVVASIDEAASFIRDLCEASDESDESDESEGPEAQERM